MDASTLKRKVRSDTLWATLLRGLTAVSALGINVAVTRLLPPDEVAVFYLIASMVSLLAFVGSFGLHVASVRFIAGALGMDDQGRARTVVGRVLALSVAGGLCVGLVVWLGGLRLVNDLFYHSEILAQAGLVVGGWAFLWAVQLNLAEVFRGFGDVRLAVLSRRLAPNVAHLLIMAVVFALWPGADLWTVLWAGLVGWALCVLLGIGLAAAKVRGLARGGKLGWGELLRTSWPLGVSVTLSYAVVQLDIWVLGALVSMDELALYGSAAKLTRFVIFPLFILTATLPPLISRLFARGELAPLEGLLRRASGWAGLFGVVGVLVSLVVGAELLGLLFGGYYAAAEPYLQLLLAGLLFRLVGGASQMTLMMTGNERPSMYVSMVSAAIVGGGGLVLGRTWGAMGMAWAVLAAQVVSNVANIWLVRRLVGINSLPVTPAVAGEVRP